MTKLLVLIIGIFFTNTFSSASTDPAEMYGDAERFFLKKNYSQTTEVLNQLFTYKNFSDQRMLAKAHNLKGLIYFQSKNPSAAIEEFGKSVSIASNHLSPEDSVLHLAKYNLANALYSLSQVSAALEVINTIHPDSIDLDTRIRYFHLKGNVLNASEQHVSALLAVVNAANLVREPASADVFLQKINNFSKKLFVQNPRQELAELLTVYSDLSKDQPGTLALQVVIARGQLYIGKNEEAQSNLKDFLDKATPAHPMRARAQEMVDQFEKLAHVEPNNIGLLLPLSGKFAKFGRLCLNAVLLAQGAFENMEDHSAGSKITFAVRDSGDTAESALEAFEELATQEHVTAVIGPLLSKQAVPVAQKAQEYGMPLFSLSQKKDLDKIGSYIFPIALSPFQQIETVLNHAIDNLGLKKLVILAPSDPFGDEYVKLFWDLAEEKNAEIVAIERYEPKSTDFRDEIKKILGLEYEDARTLELAELKRRESTYAGTLKAKGNLRKRLLKAFELKPIVAFDAVFIPDDPQIVGQIVPAFAVKGVENIPFLGINTWNTPEIVQRAGRYLQQSLFVDAFFPYAKNKQVTTFVEDFTSNYGSSPATLEAQAFDAANILIKTIFSGDISSRSSLKDKIINQSEYSGITGGFRFTEKGVQRTAYLLTVSGNNILEASPPSSKTEKKE